MLPIIPSPTSPASSVGYPSPGSSRQTSPPLDEMRQPLPAEVVGKILVPTSRLPIAKPVDLKAQKQRIVFQTWHTWIKDTVLPRLISHPNLIPLFEYISAFGVTELGLVGSAALSL